MKLMKPSNMKEAIFGVAIWVTAITLGTVGVLRAMPVRETVVFAAYEKPVTQLLLEAENIQLSRQNEELQIRVASLETTLAENRQVPLTDAELELVCRVVAAEARGESYRGQLGVAQVIRDRFLSGYYGETITEVVTMANQFAYPWDGDLDLYPTVAQAVNEVFNGKDVFDGDALYFFNPATSNQGAVETIREGSSYFGVIGRHEFRGLE